MECSLEEVEEEILLGLKAENEIVVTGEFNISDDLDAYLWVDMANSRIVTDEESDTVQE